MISCVHKGAPAKLNLSLRVLPRRSDGFHGIESIFQRISLRDELDVALTSEKGECIVDSPLMRLPDENTLTKAVSQFRLVSGFQEGVRIRIEKHIPAGSGLGGGSSDAAAVLRALNELTCSGFSDGELSKMGAAVGSDVPFFLSGPCAVVTGRGELVAPIEARADVCFVLICPEAHSSTAEAYRRVDEWEADGRNGGLLWSSPGDLEKIYRGFPGEWSFHNSFTLPLIHAFPVIDKALAGIRATGALFAGMSGSGSSVFGVYLSAEKAREAQEKLFSEWRRCYFVLPLDF